MSEREFNILELIKKIQPAITPAFAGVICRILLIVFTLLSIINVPKCNAQWKPIFAPGVNSVLTIYFIDLPGRPRVGFATLYGGVLLKTTDGGNSWRQITLPADIDYLSGLMDIVFKDSLTGWIAVMSGVSDIGGCIKTTDCGETWSSILPGSESFAYAIYYNKKSDGLFLPGGGDGPTRYTFVSWDEGATWQTQLPTSTSAYGGCAFSNDDTGIICSNDFWALPWCRTTDAGRTWAELAIDSQSWYPLAIPGTQTYFANTGYGNILRTDDGWNSWRVVYSFPPISVPYNSWPARTAEVSRSITGVINNLFVQFGPGIYRSTDQGITWNYLCGPGWENVSFGTQFYVKNNLIYCATNDSAENVTLWELDLDSLYNISSNISEQFPDGSKRTSVSAGSNVTVNYVPHTDTLVGIDSVMLAIHYDSASLSLNQINIPSPWSILDSSLRGNVLDLLLTDTSAEPLPSPILQLTFGTFLTSSLSAKVYLDSVHLYGHRLNCDCAVQSILTADTASHASAIDSVEIDFTGCGDSLLLAAMQGQPPFSIQLIDPNPTTGVIQVILSKSSPSLQVEYEVLDLLGRAMQSGLFASENLDLSGLPSGSYYLRLSNGGFVETRKVIVSR